MGDNNTVKIRIEAEVEASQLKNLEQTLQRQIITARALGKPYADLETQLTGVRSRLAGLAQGTASGTDLMAKSAEAMRGKWEAAGKELVSKIPGIGPQLAELGGAFTPVVAALGAVAIAAGVAWKAVQKFSESETAVTSLDAGLAARGELTEAYRQKLQALAATMAGMTGKSNTEWLGAFATLTKFGADNGNIEETAKAVKNLAGFMGSDLQSAAFLVGKALQGQFTMLRRYGIQVDQTADQATKLKSVFAQLELRGGGQLEAQTRTIAGHFTELEHAVGGFFRGLGNVISRTRILQVTLEALTIPLKALNALFPQTIEAVEGLSNKRIETPALGDTSEAMAKLGGEAEEAAEGVDNLASAYKHLSSALDDGLKRIQENADALQKLKDAQATLALEEVNLAEAQKKISPEEASQQRTQIKQAANEDKTAAAKQTAQDQIDAINATIHDAYVKAVDSGTKAQAWAGQRDKAKAAAAALGLDTNAGPNDVLNAAQKQRLEMEEIYKKHGMDNGGEVSLPKDFEAKLNQAQRAEVAAKAWVDADAREKKYRDESNARLANAQKLDRDNQPKIGSLKSQMDIADLTGQSEAAKIQAEALKAADEQAKRRTDLWRGASQAEAHSARDLDRQRLENWERDKAAGTQAGMSEGEASQYAGTKTYAADQEVAAKKEALALEIRLSEAKAAGNEKELRRLEWIKEYNRVLAASKSLGVSEPNAEAAARRSANAKDDSRKEDRESGWANKVTAYSSNATAMQFAALAGGRSDGERTVATLQTLQTALVSRLDTTTTKITKAIADAGGRF